MTVTNNRFYKVLTIVSLIFVLMGISMSTLTYYLGVSKGKTNCRIQSVETINAQLRKDNETIQKELGEYSDTDPYDYLLHY